MKRCARCWLALRRKSKSALCEFCRSELNPALETTPEKNYYDYDYFLKEDLNNDYVFRTRRILAK